MSEARIGWGGEFHLSTDETPSNYFELVEVVSFGLPNDQADEVEVTHLKSPNKRKEYIRGLLDGGEVEVSLNYDPGSATDLAIVDARDTGDVRAIKFVLPDQTGEPEWEIETFGFVKGYARGPVQAGEKIESTVTIRITGAQEEQAVAS